MAAVLYSLVRVVLDAIVTSHSNEAKLRAEVLNGGSVVAGWPEQLCKT